MNKKWIKFDDTVDIKTLNISTYVEIRWKRICEYFDGHNNPYIIGVINTNIYKANVVNWRADDYYVIIEFRFLTESEILPYELMEL